MYSIQSNAARFIYTLNNYESKNLQNNKRLQCRLPNGLYFTKESRSDEKIRYTETDMYSIMRTVLFMHVFRISPNESLVDIVNGGKVTYDYDLIKPLDHLTLNDLIELYDKLFGDGFSAVTSRVLNKCYNEYLTQWRYYPYIKNIKLPSALDYLNCARFINAQTYEYDYCERFITTNSTDNKIPLQQNIKNLQ